MQPLELVEKIIEPVVPGSAPELRALVEAEDRIREQRYMPDKQTAELSRARQSTVERLLARTEKAIREADSERDKKLAAIQTEQAQKRDLPARGFADTDGEYNGKLLKRAIAESQRVYEATMTAADLQVLTTVSDPQAIEGMVRDAMDSRSPESFSRIAMVAEARLASLSEREARKGQDGGPAFRARVSVQTALQGWRRKVASQSPEARRDAVRGEHALRVAQIQSAVKDAAKLFRIDDLLTRAGTLASAKTAQ